MLKFGASRVCTELITRMFLKYFDCNRNVSYDLYKHGKLVKKLV